MNGYEEKQCSVDAEAGIGRQVHHKNLRDPLCTAAPVRELQGAVVLERLNDLTDRLNRVTGEICGRCACISSPEEEIDVCISDPMPDFFNEVNVRLGAIRRDIDRLNQLISRLEI